LSNLLQFVTWIGCALVALVLMPISALGQDAEPALTAELRAHIVFGARQTKESAPAAALWLTPVTPQAIAPVLPAGHFTLVQKHRMFTPHLLVVPVGSVVSFPNADPFFHNVFSLFNGKRFDLGLYEAGKSKDVVFSREGVSYIFCNIHPEMSAVVLSLASRHYAIADRDDNFRMVDIPPGEYEVHAWIEGLTQLSLDRLVRRVHLSAGKSESVDLDVHEFSRESANHLNKFGQPYEQAPKPTY
jgi:plastocyanin